MTYEERAYNYASKKSPSKFTVGEIAKHYNDGYIDGYKDAVNKACEWLDNNLPLYWGQVNADNTDGFIRMFKKATEEQE